MISVLFVCHGNICRSPMAEFIMKDMLIKRGISDKFILHLPQPAQRKSGMALAIRSILRRRKNWQNMEFPVREKEQYRLPDLIMENMIIY